MNHDFWFDRWKEGQIGFHRADVNPQLQKYHRVLNDTVRILVPLCGKSVDLEWLAVQGFEVVGVELSPLAAEAFFTERGFVPEQRTVGPFREYRHGAVSILCGDFFAATTEDLGVFDAVYDRAAMIALPPEMRARYVAHLPTLLAPKAKLLLVTLHYDAEGGPPFSVSPEEVAASYPGLKISRLGTEDARDGAPGPMQRGATFVNEDVYLVQFM